MDQSRATKPEPDQHHAPHSSDYAPYPKLDPNDVDPPVHLDSWSTVSMGTQSHPEHPVHVEGSPAPVGTNSATTMPPESNPYVSSSPAPSSLVKNKVDSVKDVLGKWGQKAAEATKRAEDLAGNMWQHLKTAPSFADATVGRIAQGTKVLAEGGYEKIFQQTFETVPEEQLLKSYACYLSTSSGPVIGVLYMSTAKLAFSSDSPLSYQVGEKTEWSYYKAHLTLAFWTSPRLWLMGGRCALVCTSRLGAAFQNTGRYCPFLLMVVIPLDQLKAVNPSTSKINAAEKYIQIISVDNHEFWFMGFVNYDSAVKNLQGALQPRSL